MTAKMMNYIPRSTINAVVDLTVIFPTGKMNVTTSNIINTKVQVYNKCKCSLMCHIKL